MSEKKPKPPSGEKIYYIGGDVGNDTTVILGEHITNIQQMFPKTADGEFLSQQFKKLVEEIGGKSNLERVPKEVAVEKTMKVAEAIANVEKSPDNLEKVLYDAKSSLTGKVRWIWDRITQIVTSEAAQNSIMKVAKKGFRTAIKVLIGV